MIKGLTLAESLGVSNYSGSVSLVKYAFVVAQRRDPIEAMALAAWIVDQSDNPYIPFEIRKIRHAFERIKDRAQSWEECRKQLDQWEQNERDRQSRLAHEEAECRKFVHEEKRAIRNAVRSLCNAEKREVQIAKSSAQMQLLAELSKLSPKPCLEHIAWDDCHLSISDDELQQVKDAWKWVNEHLRVIFVECNNSRDEFLKNVAAK